MKAPLVDVTLPSEYSQQNAQKNRNTSLERFCSAPKSIFKSILSLIFYCCFCCFYHLLMQDFYALPFMAENRI